jgi:ribosomal protein S18 acetylase RimI-like enzyme
MGRKSRMGLRDDATIAIRPCRLEECAAVLALWERAGAIPSPTDTLEELERLVRTHGDGFLVAIQGHTVVGSVIAGWDGWRGNIYRLAVAPEARRRRLAQRLVREAALVMRSKGGRRLSALVERHERHAVGFWDHLAADGWRRDERMMRYVRASD